MGKGLKSRAFVQGLADPRKGLHGLVAFLAQLLDAGQTVPGKEDIEDFGWINLEGFNDSQDADQLHMVTSLTIKPLTNRSLRDTYLLGQ